MVPPTLCSTTHHQHIVHTYCMLCNVIYIAYYMGLYTTLSHKYIISFRITRDYSIIDLEYSLVVIVYNFNAIFFVFKKGQQYSYLLMEHMQLQILPYVNENLVWVNFSIQSKYLRIREITLSCSSHNVASNKQTLSLSKLRVIRDFIRKVGQKA